MKKLKVHLFTLPRWFAAPYFGGSLLLGAILAGGLGINAWIGLLVGMLVMAGGHSFNSFLDYAWTGLDKGEIDERSAEKNYAGGQSLIAQGIVSEREVFFNAVAWYALAMIPATYLGFNVSWWLPCFVFAGMGVTFWYSAAKFNWTHEVSLAVGVGPLAVLIGMFSVSNNPPVLAGLLVSPLMGIILCFLGLPLDEYPDAEANLKKGVKSVAYKVWEYGVSLEWYVSAWLIMVYVYQVFLIAIGVLNPLTGLTFIVVPPMLMLLVMLQHNFEKVMYALILVSYLYPILLVLGQL